MPLDRWLLFLLKFIAKLDIAALMVDEERASCAIDSTRSLELGALLELMITSVSTATTPRLSVLGSFIHVGLSRFLISFRQSPPIYLVPSPDVIHYVSKRIKMHNDGGLASSGTLGRVSYVSPVPIPSLPSLKYPIDRDRYFPRYAFAFADTGDVCSRYFEDLVLATVCFKALLRSAFALLAMLRSLRLKRVLDSPKARVWPCVPTGVVIDLELSDTFFRFCIRNSSIWLARAQRFPVVLGPLSSVL